MSHNRFKYTYFGVKNKDFSTSNRFCPQKSPISWTEAIISSSYPQKGPFLWIDLALFNENLKYPQGAPRQKDYSFMQRTDKPYER